MTHTADRTSPFEPARRLGLPPALIESIIARHDAQQRPRLELFWAYYRNTAEPAVMLSGSGGMCGRGMRLAQERGLPARISGGWDRRPVAAQIAGLSDDRTWGRKEVVVENDIAWRIHAMVDFMFGRPVTISSTARDPQLRRTITRVLDAVWESSGGIALLQDMGLLGHIFGSVDLIVRAAHPSGEGVSGADANAGPHDADAALLAAATAAVRVAVIEPAGSAAIPRESDPRSAEAFVIRTTNLARDAEPAPLAQRHPLGAAIRRWFSSAGAPGAGDPAIPHRAAVVTTEVLCGSLRQIYTQVGDAPPVLVHEGPALAALREHDAPPVIHIQNISQPFAWAGLGEVEPLIPLQDELNTRLSDRASRVTLQSFKMLLARGVENAHTLPVAPGVIWSTDNPDASIQPFGGDAHSPSEDAHIEQIREAMDKASGVPPLASGVVRAKIGNLTSENALKVTLMGLLSKTARKRVTYGRGIAQASALVLDALDRLNILKTTPADRTVRIDWTDPLPRDERQALTAALQKIELGVPRERVLSELGYGASDDGLT